MVAANTVPFFPTAIPLEIDDDGSIILPPPVPVKPLSEARRKELGILDCPVEDIPWISNGGDVSVHPCTRQSKELTRPASQDENTLGQVDSMVCGDENERNNNTVRYSSGGLEEKIEQNQSDLDDVAVALEWRFNNNNNKLKYGKFKAQFDEGEELGLLLHRRMPGSCGLRVKKIYDDGQACKFSSIQVGDFAVGLNGKDIRFLSEIRNATGKREITFIRINDAESQHRPLQIVEDSTNATETTIQPVRPLGSENDRNVGTTGRARALAVSLNDQNNINSIGDHSVDDESQFRDTHLVLHQDDDTEENRNFIESPPRTDDGTNSNCQQSTEQSRNEPESDGLQEATDQLFGSELSTQRNASEKNDKSSSGSTNNFQKIYQALKNTYIQESKFCDGAATSLPSAPSISLAGVGVLSLPLSDASFQLLLSYSRNAQEENDIIGSASPPKKSIKISFDQLEIKNTSWSSSLSELVVEAGKKLGVPQPAKVTWKEDSLLSYMKEVPIEDDGDYDIANRERFATLLIQLPSRVCRGHFEFQKEKDKQRYSLTTNAQFGCSYVAFTKDFEFRGHAEGGCCTLLRYSLFYEDVQKRRLGSLLETVPIAEQPLIIPLQNEYTSSSLSRHGIEVLKGGDRAKALAISTACRDCWKVVIANAKRNEIGQPNHIDDETVDFEGVAVSEDGSEYDISWMKGVTGFYTPDGAYMDIEKIPAFRNTETAEGRNFSSDDLKLLESLKSDYIAELKKSGEWLNIWPGLTDTMDAIIDQMTSPTESPIKCIFCKREHDIELCPILMDDCILRQFVVRVKALIALLRRPRQESEKADAGASNGNTRSSSFLVAFAREVEVVETACRSDLDSALTRFCDTNSSMANAERALCYLTRNNLIVNWKQFSLLVSRFLHQHTSRTKDNDIRMLGTLLSIIPQDSPRSSSDCKVVQGALEACASSEGVVQDDIIESIKARVFLTSDETCSSMLGLVLRYEIAVSIEKFCTSASLSNTFSQVLAFFRGSLPESLASDCMGLDSVDSSIRQVQEAILRLLSECPNEKVLNLVHVYVSAMVAVKPVNMDIVFAVMELLETLVVTDGGEVIFHEIHPVVVEILAQEIANRRSYFVTGCYFGKSFKFLLRDQGERLSLWGSTADILTAERFWRASVQIFGKADVSWGDLANVDRLLKSFGKKVLERKLCCFREEEVKWKDLAEKEPLVKRWPVDPTAKFKNLPQQIRTFILSDQRGEFTYSHQRGTAHSQWLCTMSKPGFVIAPCDSEDSVVVTKTKHDDLLQLMRLQRAIGKYSSIQQAVRKAERQLAELQNADGNGGKLSLYQAPVEAVNEADSSPNFRRPSRYTVEFQPGKLGLRLCKTRERYGFMVGGLKAAGQASLKMVKLGDIAHKLNGKIIESHEDIEKNETAAKTIEFLRVPNMTSRVRLLAAPVPVTEKRPKKRARVATAIPAGSQVITIDD